MVIPFTLTSAVSISTITMNSEEKQNLENKDLNDLFDEIVLTEEHFSRASYEEGYKKGCEEGAHEGYQLGYAQGLQLGQELGNIYGTVVAQQKLKNHTDKVNRTLQQLRLAIELFPLTNDANFDLIGEVENIRTLYRKLSAMITTTATASKSKNKHLTQHNKNKQSTEGKDYSF